MDSGRNLDADVARKIFREVVMFDESGEPKIKDMKLNRFVPVPLYSTDTDDSYRILRYFQAKGYVSHVESTLQNDALVWVVKLMLGGSPIDGVWGRGTSLAHAVCVAGLALNSSLK